MDISLIETLRWEPDVGFVRLDRHLARLKRSADALGLTGADGAEEALTEAVKPPPLSSRTEASPLRVRLELFAESRIEVKTAPFIPLAPDVRWTLGIAVTRLNSSDPLLRHKTSRRAVYDTARAEFATAQTDEVILSNERGEVCEGTITSIFVDDGSGVLKTPPLSCGLLAGVLREELIETGRAQEARLQVEDISHQPLFVGNSLRGLIPARLA